MRGYIARPQSFTLGIEWCLSGDEIDCHGCQGTISGEAYSIMPPNAATLVLCRTCAYELQGDLEYALQEPTA